MCVNCLHYVTFTTFTSGFHLEASLSLMCEPAHHTRAAELPAPDRVFALAAYSGSRRSHSSSTCNPSEHAPICFFFVLSPRASTVSSHARYAQHPLYLFSSLQSEHAPLFIRYNDLFSDDEADEEDVKKVYTRTPKPPFIEVTHDDGSVQRVWSSFTEEQIDIDVFGDAGRSFISEQVSALCPTCAPTAPPFHRSLHARPCWSCTYTCKPEYLTCSPLASYSACSNSGALKQ